jgi:hypothetical protein
MEDLVALMIRQGDETGAPVVGDHEPIPQGGIYKLRKSRRHSRRSTHPNQAFPYLRDASVNGAITGMRNSNHFPIHIPARHMPDGEPAFSNFTDILIEFWAWYCALEGIPRTNNFARQILLYVFYATYLHKITEKKVTSYVPKPIIHGIHYKLTNGRARFMNKVESASMHYFIC